MNLLLALLLELVRDRCDSNSWLLIVSLISILIETKDGHLEIDHSKLIGNSANQLNLMCDYLIGSLTYLMITRLDFTYTLGVVSRPVASLHMSHRLVAK